VNAVRKDVHSEILDKSDNTLAKTKFVFAETKPNKAHTTHVVEAIDLLKVKYHARMGFEKDRVPVVALHQRDVGASRVE
jgi:hypothetical protein